MMKLWYLSKINALEDLTDAEMREIDSKSVMKKYKKNSHIYSGSNVAGNVYLLKKGIVRIYKVSDMGKEVTLQILNAGDIFGDLFLNREASNDREAKAISDVLLCRINKTLFFDVLMRNKKAFARLNEELGEQITELEELLSMFAFKNIDQRVCFILKKIYDKFGPEITKINLTHDEIAKMIGATRESTTLTLDKIRDLGIIDLSRGTIRIKDISLLTRIEECGLDDYHTH